MCIRDRLMRMRRASSSQPYLSTRRVSMASSVTPCSGSLGCGRSAGLSFGMGAVLLGSFVGSHDATVGRRAVRRIGEDRLHRARAVGDPPVGGRRPSRFGTEVAGRAILARAKIKTRPRRVVGVRQGGARPSGARGRLAKRPGARLPAASNLPPGCPFFVRSQRHKEESCRSASHRR